MGCKQTPPLPFEIIVYILESYVDTNSRLDGDYMVIPFVSQSKFIQDCKFVRNCSLVSTHWNAASRDVLSRLRTIVGKCSNAQAYLNLLDVQSTRSYPIRHLVFYMGERPTKERDKLGHLATELLYKCTSLHFLEVDSGGMSLRRVLSSPVPFGKAMPTFAFLRQLSIRFHPLADVAGFLQHCPNLKAFYLTGSTYMPVLENSVEKVTAVFPWSSPLPSFSLNELHIFDSDFTAEECRWLLTSSLHTLTTLHLFHVWALSPLASVLALTSAVKHLYLRPLRTSRFQGVKDNYLPILASLKGLKTLRLDGLEGFWTTVFVAIADTGKLESLDVELRLEVVEPLVQVLSHPEWQRGLRTLVVRHRRCMDHTWRLSRERVEDAQKQLEEVCAGRDIVLRWITLDQPSILYTGYRMSS